MHSVLHRCAARGTDGDRKNCVIRNGSGQKVNDLPGFDVDVPFDLSLHPRPRHVAGRHSKLIATTMLTNLQREINSFQEPGMACLSILRRLNVEYGAHVHLNN